MTRRISLAMTLLTGLLVIAMSIPLVVVFRSYQYDRLSSGWNAMLSSSAVT